MMRRLLKSAPWLIPVVLSVSFFVYAAATQNDLLGAARLVLFYGLGLTGMFLAKLSNVRQLRALAREGRKPTVYLVADTYRNFALVLLLIALFLTGANTLLPVVPDVPRSLILGLIGSGCAAFFTIGLIQHFAGKRRLGGMEVDFGPLWIATLGVRPKPEKDEREARRVR